MKARHKARRLSFCRVSALHVLEQWRGFHSAEYPLLFDRNPHPSITHMKRFLKRIGCGKSPEPPEQHIPLRKSTSIAARPPDPRAEPDVIPDGE